MSKTKSQTIEEYIAGFPEDIRVILQQIRTTIKSVVPEAGEKIAYDMPTFTLNGNLITYAAWKKHIALYPAPVGMEEELAPFKGTKSSLHFRLSEPMPLDLIKRIVALRVEEFQAEKQQANRMKE